ncbi:TonB-dependent receptor [Algiphilus sp.]|uniref:TonB-dependent receptor n=1 Tax=Algiphilus sp. TaxID=1872431 RepID=UPI003B51CFC9
MHPRFLLSPLWLRAGACCLALSMTPSAHADEEQTASATELGDVIVTAKPLRPTPDEVVQSTDVLTGEALARERSGTIGDVLEYQPGIANSSFGPGVGRPIIRGQGGPRVQILQNGIASMDASALSPDHAVSIDPLGADQVEVIRGPATLLYGGGSSGGVVNVVDDRLPDSVIPGFRATADLSYGDNADERQTALRARYGLAGVQFGAHYSRREAGNFDIPGRAERSDEHEHEHEEEHAHEGEHEESMHPEAHEAHDEHEEHGEDEARGVLPNSSLEAESFGASVAWAGERGMIGAAVSRFTTNYGVPGHGHGHGEEHGEEHGHEEGGAHEEEAHGHEEEGHSHEDVRIDLEQTRTDLRGLLYDPFPGFVRLEGRVGINDYTHAEIEPSGEIGTKFDVQALRARVLAEHKPLGDWAGVIGTQFVDRDFEAVGEEAYVPPVQTQEMGLFLVEGLRFGEGHRLELGARFDATDHETEGNQPAQDFGTYTLSAGVNYMLADHLHLRGNLQRSQRAPAAEELYADGAHAATSTFERGDVNLDPETANSVDLALVRDAGTWTWSVGAFYSRIDDYIFLREVDAGLNADGSGTGSTDGEADFVNEEGEFEADGELLLVDYAQENAVFFGAEVETRFHFIEQGQRFLSVGGFADLVRGELRDSNDHLPRVTPPRVGVDISGGLAGVSARLGYIRVTEQDRTAPLESVTPAYNELRADLSYTLATASGPLSVYLRARNLLDDTQREATSVLKDVAPAPGRSLFVGLRMDFDPARAM